MQCTVVVWMSPITSEAICVWNVCTEGGVTLFRINAWILGGICFALKAAGALSYLAQIAVLHCDLSIEKVHIIPILCCVQEMRFWGRHRGRELKCISASSPPLWMLNISGICTRLYMTGGDLDCRGENRPYPHGSWQSRRALYHSKNSSDSHIHAVNVERHNGRLARWQADACTSRKPRWERNKVWEWWRGIRLPLSHLESYLIVLKADPSPILR